MSEGNAHTARMQRTTPEPSSPGERDVCYVCYSWTSPPARHQTGTEGRGVKGTPPPQATQSDASQLGWGDQPGRPFREEEGRHGSAQRRPRPRLCARQCGQRCQGRNSCDLAGVRVLTPPVRGAAQSCQLRKRDGADPGHTHGRLTVATTGTPVYREEILFIQMATAARKS